jgi:hypothetical protein
VHQADGADRCTTPPRSGCRPGCTPRTRRSWYRTPRRWRSAQDQAPAVRHRARRAGQTVSCGSSGHEQHEPRGSPRSPGRWRSAPDSRRRAPERGPRHVPTRPARARSAQRSAARSRSAQRRRWRRRARAGAGQPRCGWRAGTRAATASARGRRRPDSMRATPRRRSARPRAAGNFDRAPRTPTPTPSSTTACGRGRHRGRCRARG